jgi:hypothetical protein
MVSAEVLWGTTSDVFTQKRFPEGSRLITSSLGAPVEGMSLAAEDTAARPEPDGRPHADPAANGGPGSAAGAGTARQRTP